MSESTGESLRDRLIKATLLLAFINLLSRILGFFRDAAIAYKFGLSPEVDAYVAAIHVPDILNYLVAGGALSSTFVPLFQEYWQRERRSAAWTFFAVVTSVMLVVVLLLVAGFEVFTRPVVGLIYGHGKFTPEQMELVVRITRIILPAQVFFVVSGVINGVIYAVRGDDRWYVSVPSIGALIYNLGIIGGGLALSDRLGIEAFAWGGLVGAFLGPFLLVALAARSVGARYRFRIRLNHPGLRRFVLLTLPLMIAVSFSFVDQIVATIFGTHLSKGSIAALQQAYRLMLVPVGLFGMQAATAIIGTLARLAAEGDIPAFRTQVREALNRVGIMILPVTVLMVVLASPIVRVLLQRGAFDPEATARVASALRWYALGMYAWSVNYVLARAMYSLQDTKTPAILGTVTTAVMVPVMWLLMRPMGADGLALGTTIGITLLVVALFLALRRKLRGLHLPAILRSLRHLTLAAAFMGAVCWGAARLMHGIPQEMLGSLAPASGSLAGALLEITVVTALGLPAFVAASLALGEEGAAYYWGRFAGKVMRLVRRGRRTGEQ